jgi:transposase
MGRPSLDPELLIRMLLIGYCMGIRSERRLCEKVHLNLAYRWFCQLGLDGIVPDHSTFSKNRHGRFCESNLLREVFELTVRRCIETGLVGGEGFAVDVSLIQADANRRLAVPGDEGLPPDAAGRAVQEYLTVLDDAAFGASTPVVPKKLSPTDPAARYSAATPNQAFFSYSTNYLIDLRHAVIVDVEATTLVRQAEVTAQRRMIERVQQTFGLWPERLAADGAYGDAANLAWLVEEQRGSNRIFLCLINQPATMGRWHGLISHSIMRMTLYTCPGGHQLRASNRNFTTPCSRVDKDGFIRYRARVKDCSGCEFRQRCTPDTLARKIMRSMHEGARDMARDIALICDVFSLFFGESVNATVWSERWSVGADKGPSPGSRRSCRWDGCVAGVKAV